MLIGIEWKATIFHTDIHDQQMIHDDFSSSLAHLHNFKIHILCVLLAMEV